MYFLKMFSVLSIFLLVEGLYDFQINDINGSTISLSDFQGKKILIVNSATNSPFVNQYASLEQLYQKFSDSLVIIAVPSNSFGNEPGENDSIRSYISTYDIHYILTAKMNVIGDSSAPLYQWLAQNNQPANFDFCKFLISDSGTVIGVFDGSVDPMSDMIQDMIQNQ